MFINKRALIFLSFSLGALACTAPVENQPAPAETHAEAHADELTLTAAQIETAKIGWGEMEQARAANNLRLSGELRIHKEYTATVSAYADGIVQSLNTGINKVVKKGDVLAKIQHPQLLDWQQEYLATQSQLDFLQSEFERYESLKKDNATSSKSYEKAKADLNTSKVNMRLLAAKLALFKIDASQLSTESVRDYYVLRAPFSGVVSHTMVNLGSAVSTGTPICELMQTDKIHADLFVFEKDLGKVRVGQSVQLILPGVESPVPAKISSMDPGFDADKKAVRIHATFNQPRGARLVDQAYAEGLVDLNTSSEWQPALPEEAVVLELGGHYIFVVEEEGKDVVHFRKALVETEPATEGMVLVRPQTKLPENAQIVKKGAYYVASQGGEMDHDH
jgi:cobalt-zinc-cadmium efflux system membrane fusion protein